MTLKIAARRWGVLLLAFWLFCGWSGGYASAQFITQAPNDDPVISRQQLTIKLDDATETRAELAFPKTGNGPFPAVLLLGGSGLVDMDGGNRPPPNIKNYKEMADNLVRQGFIVFRYNKRGVNTNGQAVTGLATVSRTNSLLVNDAATALRFFQNQSKVDRDKLFVLGHSQGTLIAAQLAQRFPGLIKGLLLTGTITDWNLAFDYQLVTRFLNAANQADQNKDGLLTSEELGAALSQNNQVYANLERSNLLYEKVMIYFPKPVIRAGQPVQVGALLSDSGIDKDKDGKLSIENELKPALLEARRNYLDNADLLKASGESREAIQSLVNGPKMADLLLALAVPVYFQHGSADERIPANTVRELETKLESTGVPAAFTLYQEVDHNFIPTETLDKIALNQSPNYNNVVPTQVLKDQSDWLQNRVRALSTTTVTPTPGVTPAPNPQPNVPVTGYGQSNQTDFDWQFFLLIALSANGSLAAAGLLYAKRKRS